MKKRTISLFLVLALVLALVPAVLVPASAEVGALEAGWEFSGDIGVRYAVNGVETDTLVTGRRYSIQIWLQNIGPYSLALPLKWDPSVARIIDPGTGQEVPSGRMWDGAVSGFRVGSGCYDDGYDPATFDPLFWNGKPIYSTFADRTQGYPYLDQENGVYRFLYYIPSPNAPMESQLVLEVYFELIGSGDPNFHFATTADGPGCYDPAEPDGLIATLPQGKEATSVNYTRRAYFAPTRVMTEREYNNEITTPVEEPIPSVKPTPTPSVPTKPPKPSYLISADHLECFPYAGAAEVQAVIKGDSEYPPRDSDYIVPVSLISSVVNRGAAGKSSIVALMPNEIIAKDEYTVFFQRSNIDDMVRSGLSYLYFETPWAFVGLNTGLLTVQTEDDAELRLTVKTYLGGIETSLTVDGQEVPGFSGPSLRIILPKNRSDDRDGLPVSTDVLAGTAAELPLSLNKQDLEHGAYILLSPSFGVVDIYSMREETFSDIDSVPWAVESIEALAKRLIVNGVGGGLFDPNAPVTREQFATMIVKTYAMYSRVAGSAGFTDVPPGNWAEPYIDAAAAAGLVNGIGGGRFGYGQEISRQDLCVMAYRGLKQLGVVLPETQEVSAFADDGQIADYAKEAVYALSRAGIVNGVGGGRFDPRGTANRAQAAKIMYGVLQPVLELL